MFGVVKLVGLIVFSHTLYDLMKDDRKEWVTHIRKYVAKKWHEAEQRVVGVGNGQKEA